MKYLINLLVILAINACHSQSSTSYEEGLENCKHLREAQQKENPGNFPYIPPACMEGATMPDFTALSMDGKEITHENLKGKITILNFWFISCPPCVAEIPGFNAIIEKFGKDKVNYIAIGRDSKKDIEDFLKGHPWEFTILPDNDYLIDDVFKIRWGFPTTFLLNQKGEIMLAFSGGKTDESAVQEIQDQLVPVMEELLKQ